MPTRTCVATLLLLAACDFPRPADIGNDAGLEAGDDAGLDGGGEPGVDAGVDVPDGDFAFTLDAARVRIVDGADAIVAVTIMRNGTAEPVAVTVAGLPAGVTVDPLTIAGDTGMLSLHAAMGATQGDAVLTVTASGTTKSHDAPLSLLTMGLPGTLDLSFGAGGTLPVPAVGRAYAIAIQPDGKILISGTTQAMDGSKSYMVTRYLPDGTLDRSFAGGVVTFSAPVVLGDPASLALAPDGKIVVAVSIGHRSTQGLVLRLNAIDGSHDNEFGAGGEETFTLPGASFTNLFAVAAQQDGSIVVAGDSDSQAFVARLTTTGMLDPDFNSNGYTIVTALGTSRFLAVALQPDGRIVTAGHGTPPSSNAISAFARFKRNGQLDEGFNGSGAFMADLYNDTNFLNTASIAFQRDGKFVAVGGTINPGPGESDIARVIDTGSLDMSFAVKGSIWLLVGDARTATGLAVQPDGKFVVVGGASIGGVPSAFVARYGGDAQRDHNFGNDGFTTPVMGAAASQFQAVALDADGRIVAAGYRQGAPDELLLYRLWP